MSDLKRIALLFLACIILAAYAKFNGLIPGSKPVVENSVLGTQTQSGFGKILQNKQVQNPGP